MLSFRKMDAGVALGWAVAPFTVVLTVVGAWAETGRKKEPGPELGGSTEARVKGSAQGMAIGRMGDGGVVVGPGASLTNPVFHVGNQSPADNGPPSKNGGVGGVLVVGDVPQEPAAFQARAGLMRELEGGPGTRVVFAVTGIRGVGKTQVAAAHARRRIGQGWRLVAWVDASSVASVLEGLADVAVAAGLGSAVEDAGVLAAKVRGWLEGDGERRLLVLDNAVDLDGLRRFVPSAGAAQVVITSHRQSAAGLGAGVAVDVFTEPEALAFLGERTGLADVAGAREVAAELGFLPLGLAQAAALVAREHLDYGKYLQRLQTLRVADYLGRVTGDPYPYRTAEAILLSLRGVMVDAEERGLATRVMELVSLLAETGISRRLLSLIASDGEPGMDVAEIVDVAAVDAAVGILADASLIGFSLEDTTVVAHRLVMRVVREQFTAVGTLTGAAVEAVRVLQNLASGIGEAWRDPGGVRELAGHVSALTGYVRTGPDSPVTDISGLLELRLNSVYLLNMLGDSTGLAIMAAESLSRDCANARGPDHPTTLTTIANLAYAYQAAGRIDEALPLYERTLADREQVLGDTHPNTLTSRSNLASAYQAAGRIDEALPLYERTLADREQVLGDTHPNTLASRSNLASAYRDAGRLKEALPLFECALADRERALGDTHPNNPDPAQQSRGCLSRGRADRQIPFSL
jgi:tetratricopeptide (TPR) repeat protein